MVVIRLARGGAKKRPFYQVVAANSRSPRDGRFIEDLGFYNPIAAGKEIPVKLDMAKINAWIAKGAQLSDRVKQLVRDYQAPAAE